MTIQSGPDEFSNRTGREKPGDLSVHPVGCCWLPTCNTDRTNCPKTGWEITSFFTRAYDKGCLFVRGRKPTELAKISKISQRRWHQHEHDQERENPILTGLRYLRLFEQESVRTYAQAAEIVGVSRQRVYQLVSLVTKLPDEIKDVLMRNDDPAVLRYFTERRLRPITKVGDDARQALLFRRMLGECHAAVATQTARPTKNPATHRTPPVASPLRQEEVVDMHVER